MTVKILNLQWQERGYSRTKVVSTVTGQVISDTRSPVSVLREDSFQSVTQEIPGWRQKIKVEPVLTGELHASVTQQKTTIPIISFRGVLDLQSKVIRTTEDQPFVATGPGVGGLDTSLRTTATNKAIGQLLKKYHRQTRALQGLVFLGELRETIDLLKRPADGINHLLQRYLKRVRPHVQRYHRGGVSLKNVTKKLGDEWLQYSFGLAPLISDANDAANFYNSKNRPMSGSVPIKAYGDAESAIPPLFLRSSFPDGWFLRRTQIVKQSVHIKLRSAYNASAGPGPSANELGSSWRDFVPAVWELLPWSFFIDYFTNLGEIIDAWSYAGVFASGVQQTTVWLRYGAQEGFNWEFSPVNPALLTPVGGSISGSAYQKVKSIDRVKLSALPVPTLQVSTGLSYTRWANILALSRTSMPVLQRR